MIRELISIAAVLCIVMPSVAQDLPGPGGGWIIITSDTFMEGQTRCLAVVVQKSQQKNGDTMLLTLGSMNKAMSKRNPVLKAYGTFPSSGVAMGKLESKGWVTEGKGLWYSPTC